LHQWCERRGKKIAWQQHYHAWIFVRRTLAEIAAKLGISVKTLRKKFDAIEVPEGLVHLPDVANPAINLQIDATYFGENYGFICFHDSSRVVYFHEIKAETSADIMEGLRALKQAGYRFKSVTIDGRKGFEEAIRRELGGVPIQLCLFHARAIVRRYLGPSPTHKAAQDLAELMLTLRHSCTGRFMGQFEKYQNEHQEILQRPRPLVKRNRRRQRIRLAYRFVDNNMHRIFTFRDLPSQHIPPTTNHLEGLFSHIKERLKLHRGLKQNTKKKAIKYLLKSIPNHKK
jgi:hypothetical protein